MSNPIVKALRHILFPANEGQTLHPLFVGHNLSHGSMTDSDIAHEVGDGTASNVLMATVGWIQRAIAASPLAVKDAEDHPILQLLRRPNDFYDGANLLDGVVLSYLLDGNAYILCVRDGSGSVRELWYAPHTSIEPKWPSSGEVFISHYDYTPHGSRPIRLEPEDVIHVRRGIDPHNLRKGLSPLRALLREVWTDREAALFTAALLKNGGMPGLIVSPKDDMSGSMTVEQAEAIKNKIDGETTRGGRGRTLIMLGPTEVHQFGFSPQQLDLAPLRNVTEERIAAMYGVPAAVIGFGSGLQQTKVGATMKEMRQAAWRDGVIPVQGKIVAAIGHRLAPHFGNVEVHFDNSAVPALREDENAKVERVVSLVNAGLWTRNEGREATGQEPFARDTLLTSLSVIETDPNVARQDIPGEGKAIDRITAGSFFFVDNGVARDISADDLEAMEPAITDLFAIRIGSTATLRSATTLGAVQAEAMEIVNSRSDPDIVVIPARQVGILGTDPVFRGGAGYRFRHDKSLKDNHSPTERRVADTAPRRKPPKQLRLIADRLDRLRATHATIFAAALVPLFEAIGKDGAEIAMQVLQTRSGKAPESKSPVTVEANRILEGLRMRDRLPIFTQTFGRSFLGIAAETAETLRPLLGVGLNDAVEKAILATGGTRAGLLDLEEVARRSLNDALVEGRAAGLGGQNLADSIQSRLKAGPWSSVEIRARVVARTETAFAVNSSAVQMMRSANIQQAMVLDARLGDTDDVCEALDGTVVSLEDAEQLVADEHPNGSRSLVPITEGLREELEL